MPLREAAFVDTATQAIKSVNPDLITQVHALERRIDQIKRSLDQISREDKIRDRARKFVNKWGGIVGI